MDADPQSDLTTCMGYYNTDDILSVDDLMLECINDDEIKTKEAILHSKEQVDLLPFNLSLSQA